MTGNVPRFDPTQPFEFEGGPPKLDRNQPFTEEKPATWTEKLRDEAMRLVEPGLRAGITVAKEHSPEGVLHGGLKVTDQGAKILTKGLEAAAPAGTDFEAWAKGQREMVERMSAERDALYAKGRAERGQTGFDAPVLAGEMLMTAPAAIPGRVAAGAATLLPRLLAGAGVGGVSGAMAPVPADSPNFWGETGKNAAIGAATGGATSAILGRTNASSDPNVQALMREGVPLTPGQMSGGFIKRIEDAATSIPIVGDVIRSSQRRGVEGLNRAALDRALGPLGEKLPKDVDVGRDGVTYVQQKVSEAYTTLLPKLHITADQPFLQDVSNLHQMAQNMEPHLAKRFGTTLQEKVIEKLAPNGTMDGLTMKRIEEDLGKEAAKFRMGVGNTAAEREYGDAIADLQTFVRDLTTRSNPQHAAELQRINRAFANLATVERAAGGSAATGGIFSPNQLSTAVKAGDRTARDRAFAGGRALMQDLSDPARKVMPSSVPDSGTPLRFLTGAGVLGGAGAVEPMSASAAAALAALYTRPGQAFMRGTMARRPQGLLDAVPLLAATAPQGLLNYQGR